MSHLKTRVHHALKCTDSELGIDATGLTKHKTNKWYTKPHVLCQRLSLLKNLTRVYHKDIRPELDEECDRKELVQAYFKDSWVSKLVPKHYFFQSGKEAAEDKRALVLSSGPYVVRLLQVERIPGTDIFTCKDRNLKVWEQFAGDASDVSVAPAAPRIVEEQLSWEQASPFLSLAEYVATESILNVPRSLLSGLCSSLMLRHSKLSYRERVRLFLQFMGKDKAYMESVLEEIPEKEIPAKDEAHAFSYGLCNTLFILLEPEPRQQPERTH